MIPQARLLELLCQFLLSSLVTGQEPSTGPAAAPQEAPTEVRTAKELQSAIEAGVEHVIVRDHLDTRGIQPIRTISDQESPNIMFWLREGTRFIQVCTSQQMHIFSPAAAPPPRDCDSASTHKPACTR